MKTKPITQRAATKYGSAPKNQEVTVDAGGKTPANFARMSPVKNASLIEGAGDVGYSKNQAIEFDTSQLEAMSKDKKEDKEKSKDSGVDVGTAVKVASALMKRSPAKQTGRGATYSDTVTGKKTTTTVPGETETNYSGGGAFKNKEEREWYNDQIKKRTDSGMSQEEAVQDYRNTFKIGDKKTTTSPDKTVESQEPDEVYEGKLYRAQYGTAKSGYGSRLDSRKVLSQTRRQKRAAVDLARKQMKKGEITRKEFRDLKKQAALDMAENRVNELATLEKNRKYAQQQGAKAGDKVRLDDVQKTFGDYSSDADQMRMGIAQQKAERTRNQAAAENASNFFKKALAKSSSEPSGFNYSPSLIKPAITQTNNNLMYDLGAITSGKNPLIESGSPAFKMKGFGKNKYNK